MAEPTFEQVMTSLRNADAAGDTAAATQLASIAKRIQEKETPKQPEKGMMDKGAEAMFGQGPEAHMGGLERVKRVGEAGVIGMGTGGAIGAGVGFLGGPAAPLTVPAAASIGATTGFVAGVLGEVAEQTASNLGYGRAAQVLAGITASGPAEIVKEALPTMFRNLMPKKALIEGVLNRFKSESTLQAEKTAVLEAGQKKQFGPKTAGWEEGVDLGKNAAETQTRLQKEHKFGETRGYTATGATTEEAVKPSTALATGKEDLSSPMLGNKPAPARTQKLEPIPPREAKIDPKTGQPQKVSEVLRNEMYDEVGNLTVKNPSQRFSSSEQFKILSAKLDEHVAEGTISKADKNHLLTILKSDEGSVGSQQRYGKTVDNQIRGWAGKPGAEGKTALTQQQRNAVRNDLRNSFAEWTDKQGFGQIEKDYRSAFTQEKIAEAKDYIPRLVSDYDGKAEATQFARQMINDTPEAKNLLTQELNTHFANIKAKDIPSEFNRIRKLLVNTDIMKPEELTYLRQQVEAVEKGGDPEAIGARMKRIINRTLKVTLPASATRSAGMGEPTDNKNK